jgi:hypothetical protein
VDPEVSDAISDLTRHGILTRDQAFRVSRPASGQLLSVRAELRTLLYGGVLLTTAGVAILVGQNLDRIGPLAIVVGLAIAWLVCLAFVVRRGPGFVWTEAPSSDLAFDYILLLGILLFGSWLAYIEVKFVALGPAWPWHLLIVSLVTGALAVRYDSRTAFSLALTSFAAWRGVSLTVLQRGILPWGDANLSLRVNAIGCGVLFVVAGWLLLRARRKAHFEPVAAHLGWLLVLLALVAGLGEPASRAWAAVLVLTGGGLAGLAFFAHRFALFAFGVLGTYVGITALFLELRPAGTVAAMWFMLTASMMLVGLVLAHLRMRRGE